MIVIATRNELELVGQTDEPILITGIGAINVINALKDIPRSTPILNIGYAGSNKLPVNTRCRIGQVKLHHPVADFQDRAFILDGTTSCYTAGDFVTEADIDEPCVFDMELAYILALGFYNVRLPRCIILE